MISNYCTLIANFSVWHSLLLFENIWWVLLVVAESIDVEIAIAELSHLQTETTYVVFAYTNIGMFVLALQRPLGPQATASCLVMLERIRRPPNRLMSGASSTPTRQATS